MPSKRVVITGAAGFIGSHLSEALLDRGVLVPPLLRPRFLDDPGAKARLAAVRGVRSLTELIGATP